MKKIKLISPILVLLLSISCSKSHKKDNCTTAKNSKHQKMQTFIAPAPQDNTETAKSTDLATSTTSKAFNYTIDDFADTSDHLSVSKYAFYEITDSNQRLVKPELIEKYRRARNSNTYINLYPTDWAGIMKDRGLKPIKIKKQKTRKNRNYSLYNYYGNHQSYYRPRGLFSVFPYVSYGWNSQYGWSPNLGIVIGPRMGWGPFGNVNWNGRRNGGVNLGMSSPMPYYYNNPYHYARQYGNPYYNNIYNQQMFNNAPVVVQSNANVVPQNVQTSTDNGTKKTATDWSDGVGGPEKYSQNVKKISDYKVE